MILNVKELYLYVKRGDFMIGIIGAMEEEVASLINQMEDAESKTMAGMTLKK